MTTNKPHFKALVLSADMNSAPRYARRYVLRPDIPGSGRLPLKAGLSTCPELCRVLRHEKVIKTGEINVTHLMDFLGRAAKKTATEHGIALRSTDRTAKDVTSALIGRVAAESSTIFTSLYPEGNVPVELSRRGMVNIFKVSEAAALAITYLIKGNVNGWNTTCQSLRNIGVRVNLNGLYLPNRDLQGIDLSYTDLIKAVLTASRLNQTMLIGANVGGVDIQSAEIPNKWRPLFEKMRALNIDTATWI